MKQLSIILLCTIQFGFGQSFEYPVLNSKSKHITDIVPSQWRVLDTVSGDLNNDQLKDHAVVLETIDSMSIQVGDSVIKSKPRILAILFQDKLSNSLTLNAQSNTFILRHDHQDIEDPFASLSIEKGKLIIDYHLFSNIGSWYISNAQYQFKFIKNDFYLVEAKTTSFHRSSHDFEEYLYDFINQRLIFTSSNDLQDPPRKKVEHHSLKSIEPRTLKSLKAPFSWEITKDNYL